MCLRNGTILSPLGCGGESGGALLQLTEWVADHRANRMNVLVHDGVGVWLAARRLNQGKFHWPGIRHGDEVELDSEQLQALVMGLPWQRVGAGEVISVL
ncbi:IS66 family insertion sequence element accessory protein TnpB [Pseudomonas soli]|uniref:IS66 family insertion sequence element accessory protein TnpB n=1 Tax=Pseudomonas soli TaxID=1306993 RepID=A0ABU7GIA9_9PSED|nr:IS66 family insertion sequence element accessory protein TnpB [Pseudomonas soli]MEE1878648.1 IS66 family insertion sequence element accessory protein TnpB [Pseudomonas soli]